MGFPEKGLEFPQSWLFHWKWTFLLAGSVWKLDLCLASCKYHVTFVNVDVTAVARFFNLQPKLGVRRRQPLTTITTPLAKRLVHGTNDEPEVFSLLCITTNLKATNKKVVNNTTWFDLIHRSLIVCRMKKKRDKSDLQTSFLLSIFCWFGGLWYLARKEGM